MPVRPSRKQCVRCILEGDDPHRAAADLILLLDISCIGDLVECVFPLGDPSPDQFDVLADAMGTVRTVKRAA